MSGFLLGLVVGVLINLATALFSRERALKLIPWLVFYVLLHASYVAISSPLVNQFVMTRAHQFPSGWSYALVMLIGALLAALYWRGATVAGAWLDSATHAAVTLVPAMEKAASSPREVPTAAEIAEAINKRNQPSETDRARRYRLRKDLTQYLTRASIERDTFRILLQPAVDESGQPADPTEKLGKTTLRIQDWNTEVTFYLHSRLGEDYSLWFMNKTPSERYPGNIGDVPGLSQSWDTIASGAAKVEQLLRDFPELPGGVEAAKNVETNWRPTEGIIAWQQQVITPQVRGKPHAVKLTLRPDHALDNAIVEVRCNSPIAGMPTIDYGEYSVFAGNRRLIAPDTYHFELLHTWAPDRPATILLSSHTPLTVQEVRVRFW